jgi:single-stranded DNA-binding protein
MIDALIAGRLYGQAEERTGQSASTFVTCKVRVATDDGDTIFCNVIAFDDYVRHTLLALGDGDSVSLSGALTPKVWTDKQGNTRPALDLIAHAVLTVYHVARKRKVAQGKPGGSAQDAGFDDDRQ